VAKPETKEMPSGKMTSPPKGKGKKKAASAEMPGGEMNEPRSPAKGKGGKKR
jgi:hypothetical protein